MPSADYVLTRDITAAHLAMDSSDPDEGYQPDDVIGPGGSPITVVEWDDGGPVLVSGFANDPDAHGYINASDLVQSDERVYMVRVRQMHHAWFEVTAVSPEDALKAATRETEPVLVEYAEDFPSDTWDVENADGDTVLEGRAVDMTTHSGRSAT